MKVHVALLFLFLPGCLHVSSAPGGSLCNQTVSGAPGGSLCKQTGSLSLLQKKPEKSKLKDMEFELELPEASSMAEDASDFNSLANNLHSTLMASSFRTDTYDHLQDKEIDANLQRLRDTFAEEFPKMMAEQSSTGDYCTDAMLGDFQCAEYKTCVKISHRVFGNATLIVNFTDHQVHKLAEECKKEEAKVRARAAYVPGKKSEWFLALAAQLFPKCQKLEQVVKVYLHSMTQNYYASAESFCAFMVDWVVPVERAEPCTGFLASVSAGVAIHERVRKTWPTLVFQNDFNRSFQEACNGEGGIKLKCSDAAALVRAISLNHMAKIESSVPKPASNSSPPLSQIPQTTRDRLAEEYMTELCSALNLTAELKPLKPGANTTLLQRSGRFAWMIPQLVDVAVSKSAYYNAVGVDGQVVGGVSYDTGYGFGYHGRKHISRFAYMNQVKIGWFSSKCLTVGTGLGATVELTATRFLKFGNIAGYSVAGNIEAAYGIGGSVNSVFCCESGKRDSANNPIACSKPKFCGGMVGVSGGAALSVEYAICHTHQHWDTTWTIPIPIVKWPWKKCFPGDALVETESGLRKMEGLRVGDRVLTVTAGGITAFEDIYFFGHADPDAKALFLSLTIGGRKIRISDDHFLPRCNRYLETCRWQERADVYARNLEVGDKIWVRGHIGGLELKTITSIEAEVAGGLYNPYTMSGTIIVNDVVASCHSSWILDAYTPDVLQPWLPAIYQALFLPAKWLYQTAGIAAIGALDLNNPQDSPETFGHGPAALAVVVVGFLALGTLVTAAAMPRKTK